MQHSISLGHLILLAVLTAPGASRAEAPVPPPQPEQATETGASSSATTASGSEADEARRVEALIDSLILAGRYDEARDQLKVARERYPNHEGLGQSEAWLEWNEAFSGKFESSISSLMLSTVVGVAFVALLVLLFYALKKPFIAAGIYLTSVFLMSLPLGVAVFALMASLAELGKSVGPPAVVRHAAAFAVAAYLGAVGGTIDASFVLSRRNEHAVPGAGHGRFAFFFFKPIHGFFLASVMYLALLTGQVAVFPSGQGTVSFAAIGLLAVLTGIFSDMAIRKLREISHTMFGSSFAQPNDQNIAANDG